MNSSFSDEEVLKVAPLAIAFRVAINQLAQQRGQQARQTEREIMQEVQSLIDGALSRGQKTQTLCIARQSLQSFVDMDLSQSFGSLN